MAQRTKTPEVKYYRNLTKGPVRVQEHSLKVGGVLQVPTEETLNPKFAGAVDVLLGEISKEQYEEALLGERAKSNILGRRDLPTVVTVVEDRESPKGWKEVTQTVETDPHPKEVANFRAQQQALTEAVRPEIDHSQFPGSDFATGSRPEKS